MSTFDELDQYLVPDYQVDYWSDYAIDHATELIDQLSDSDWKCLEETWAGKSATWQIRLVEAAFGSVGHRVVLLLCQMLKTELKVALAAAESLEARDDSDTIDPAVSADLEKLLPSLNGGYYQMVEGLIGRIREQSH